MTLSDSKTVEVRIPGMLRDYCHDNSRIAVSAGTVGSALGQLKQEHPSLYVSICDETDTVRQHVNVFVNSDFVRARTPAGLGMAVAAGDVLTIWPAVSGG